MSDTKRHRDIFAADIDWHKGMGEGIRYARFMLDDGNASSPLVIVSEFEPGVDVEPHTHDANYFEYILEGEQRVGKVTFRKGDVRIVRQGTGYGPIKVGPQGCKVLIVFEQASGAATRPVGRQSG